MARDDRPHEEERPKKFEREAQDRDRSHVGVVVLSIATALLTSLIAPYVLAWFGARTQATLREDEKRAKIAATQFEVIEAFNAAFWKYRQAAGYLIWDFWSSESNKPLVDRHRREYEDAARAANIELLTQAFRARMYFNDTKLYNELKNVH
jgi:hypothetical protein